MCAKKNGKGSDSASQVWDALWLSQKVRQPWENAKLKSEGSEGNLRGSDDSSILVMACALVTLCVSAPATYVGFCVASWWGQTWLGFVAGFTATGGSGCALVGMLSGLVRRITKR